MPSHRCIVTDRFPFSALPWGAEKKGMLLDVTPIGNPRTHILMEEALHGELVLAVQDPKLERLFQEVIGERPLTINPRIDRLDPDDIVLVGEYEGPPLPDPPAFPVNWRIHWHLVALDVLPEGRREST